MASGFPGAHGHRHNAAALDSEVRTSARARLLLGTTLALVAVLTVSGLVRWWPIDASAQSQVGATQFAAPGVTLPLATVITVLTPCADSSDPALTDEQGAAGAGPPGSDPTCGAIVVRLDAGGLEPGEAKSTVTVPVPSPVTEAGLRGGDRVQLLKIPAGDGTPAAYTFLQVQRGLPLVLLLALFVLVVAVVARWRGIRALLGLAVGGLVVVKFMLPALLEGRSGAQVALVGSAAIMFVVLYLTHGLSTRTSTALAGTLFGVGITAVLGLVAVDAARLSGVASDEGAALTSFTSTLQPRDLLTCAIIVAGLGVLNDVTITQSSAVWELRSVAPDMKRRDLFTSGMRIGRDHIASTIYTIVFAYAGAALPVLLLIFIYDRPVFEMLQTESLSEEIVRTLASAIGLVLAVPVTTAIAALTIEGPTDRG